MLYKVHDNEDMVHDGADHDLSDVDNVGVLGNEQGVHFAQRGNWESGLFALHLQSLEGDHFVCS